MNNPETSRATHSWWRIASDLLSPWVLLLSVWMWGLQATTIAVAVIFVAAMLLASGTIIGQTRRPS